VQDGKGPPPWAARAASETVVGVVSSALLSLLSPSYLRQHARPVAVVIGHVLEGVGRDGEGVGGRGGGEGQYGGGAVVKRERENGEREAGRGRARAKTK